MDVEKRLYEMTDPVKLKCMRLKKERRRKQEREQVKADL